MHLFSHLILEQTIFIWKTALQLSLSVSAEVKEMHHFWLYFSLQGSILLAVPLSLNIFIIHNSPFLKQ